MISLMNEHRWAQITTDSLDEIEKTPFAKVDEASKIEFYGRLTAFHDGEPWVKMHSILYIPIEGLILIVIHRRNWTIEMLRARVLDEAFARTSKLSDHSMIIRWSNLHSIHEWGANIEPSILKE